MVLPYGSYSFTLVGDAVHAVLHLITLYQKPTPWHLYEEVNSGRFVSAKGRGLHSKFASETYSQRGQERGKALLLSFAALLSRMHGLHVSIEILLSSAFVTAESAAKVHFVAMAQRVSI